MLGWQAAARLNNKWSCWPSCNYCYLVGPGITKLVRVPVEQMAVERYKDMLLFQIIRKWRDLADGVSLWVLNITASSTGNKTRTCTPLERKMQIIDILTLATDSCFYVVVNVLKVTTAGEFLPTNVTCQRHFSRCCLRWFNCVKHCEQYRWCCCCQCFWCTAWAFSWGGFRCFLLRLKQLRAEQLMSYRLQNVSWRKVTYLILTETAIWLSAWRWLSKWHTKCLRTVPFGSVTTHL